MTSNWENKRILVTGAGGFIGSHLVERLLAEGAKVRAFVRYNSRGDPGLLRMLSSQDLARIEIIAGDLQDEDAVHKAIKGVQVVFHLGAMISIPYSYHHPVEVARTNFIGTLNILTASRELEVEKLVHTSSSEVYGSALQVPISEAHPLQGQSPYSASKIGADKLAESFYCAFELPVVTIRPFNTYGPRQSARAVIPTIITQALTRESIHLGNQNTRRDFTFVQDTVAGLMKAVDVPGVDGKVFNLGTGCEITIGELAQKIIHKTGRQVEITADPVRLRPERSEVMRLLSDNSLARKTLGWTPEVSLDDGLDRTIEWIKNHLDLYQIGTYEF
jgi:NAD dependent epimerase/dehydratase